MPATFNSSQVVFGKRQRKGNNNSHPSPRPPPPPHLTDKAETTRLRRYCTARMVHKTGPSEHSDRGSESENQNNPDAWTRARFSALGPCTAARGPPRSYQNRLLGNQTIGQRPCRCVFKGHKKICWNSGPRFLANSKARHCKTKAMTKVTWDPFKKAL